MKKPLFILLALNIFIGGIHLLAINNPLSIGAKSEAPKISTLMAFQTTTFQDEKIDLAEYFKSYDYLILNLWATWCKPCINEIPILNEAVSNFKEKNIKFIAIACDESKSKAINFLATYDFRFEQTFVKDISTSKDLWAELSMSPNSGPSLKSLPLHVLYNNKSGKFQIIRTGFESYEEYDKVIKDFFELH